jgi:cysteine desulfurase
MIYLDHNSTTPVDPRVLEEMLPYFTQHFGNAASIDHDPGHFAQTAVEKSRNQIASLIGAKPEEIIFTSGATESDNLAILGVAEKHRAKGNHIITALTEHKAVLDSCKHLETQGFEVTYLPVDADGLVDVSVFENACTDKTILATIMYANNEIGTLAPIRQIGAITRARGIVFHTDATQAVGHIPINVDTDNIDLMSMSAHKMYGPKGVGALFTRRRSPRVKLSAQIHGGGHEKGLRSGTLNVPGIVGFGKAAEVCAQMMESEANRYRVFSEEMLRVLRSELGEIELNGHRVHRLPNNLNISIPRVESKSLIVQFKDIALSTGSACTSASVEPSHVIMALGYGETRAHSAIRIGWGRTTTPADVEHAAGVIVESVNRVRKLNINI